MYAVDIVLHFVKAINRADLRMLSTFMAKDHLFIDSDGTETRGRKAMRGAWGRYFAMMPDYHIDIDETYCSGGTVVLIGRASGTYAVEGKLRARNRWSVPATWRAVVIANQVGVWQVFTNPEPIFAIMRGQKSGAAKSISTKKSRARISSSG